MLDGTPGPAGTMSCTTHAKHSAVSVDMWDAAGEILSDFFADDAVRVIVLTGAGGKAFVSGADISKFADQRANAAAEAKYDARTSQVRSMLYTSPKPTIAMIRGYCIGGGVATAITCDLRICSDDSRFGIPEIGRAHV